MFALKLMGGVDFAVRVTRNRLIHLKLPRLLIHEKGFSSSLTITTPSLQKKMSFD